MKRLYTFLVLNLINLFANFAFSQETLDKIAEDAADNIYQTIKSNKTDFNNVKIAIIMFAGKNTSTDTLKTNLGIRLTQKTANYLIKKSQKQSFQFIFPDNIESNQLKQYASSFFTPPASSKEENDYWNAYLDGKKPDYFLMAKYRIDENFTEIEIDDIRMIKNEYNVSRSKNVFSAKVVKTNILTNDKNELQKLNIENGSMSNFYRQLIDFPKNTTTNLFTFSIFNFNTKEIVKKDFKIKQEYRIQMDLLEDAYVYIFFYDAQDKERPYFSIFQPLVIGSSELFKKGTHLFPTIGAFEITPPVGQVYIKIFATKEPVKVDLTSYTNKDGSIDPRFNEGNCELFLTQLNRLKKNNIPIHTESILLNVNY